MTLPTLSFRLLLFLLAMVVLLNVLQFIVCKKKPNKGHRPYPLAIIDINGRHTASTLAPSYSLSFSNEPTAITSMSSSHAAEADNDQENENLCPQIPADLGVADWTVSLKDSLKQVQAGGFHKNQGCVAQQTVAIIVPSNESVAAMTPFLEYLHHFMINQQVDYQVFVVEETLHNNKNESKALKYGEVLNIGFLEAQKRGWQCVIFHESHLLPLDSRNLYRCSWYPRQMMMEVQTADNKTLRPVFGGPIAVTPEEFTKLNGFSNRAKGRDSVYTEFQKRLQWANHTLEKVVPEIAKYRSLLTEAQITVNETATNETLTASPFHLLDGLTTLSYSLEATDAHALCTRLVIRSKSAGETISGKVIDALLSHLLLERP